MVCANAQDLAQGSEGATHGATEPLEEHRAYHHLGELLRNLPGRTQVSASLPNASLHTSEGSHASEDTGKYLELPLHALDFVSTLGMCLAHLRGHRHCILHLLLQLLLLLLRHSELLLQRSQLCLQRLHLVRRAPTVLGGREGSGTWCLLEGKNLSLKSLHLALEGAVLGLDGQLGLGLVQTYV